MGAWEGRRALILSAAPCDDVEYVRAFLQTQTNPVILCADGGVRYAQALGIIPDVVVADFDSSAGTPVCRELIRLTPEKDDTDTQHCAEVALERGCRELTLACATGGRLDHLMANLLLCETVHEQGGRLTILDKQNTVFLHAGGCMRFARAEARKYISIIPLDRKLEKVTLRGMKYPLENAILQRDRVISVSNEAVDAFFSIEIGNGRAWIIFSEDQ
ncbi:MAG: thiamine diphosphokinase [Butyricicoccus sp.]|nr:thiamine diphosphokinase [Butyricicoccus sp.]